MRRFASWVILATLLMSNSMTVMGKDAAPDDVRSLATRGWAGSDADELEIAVALYAAYSFIFTPYCNDRQRSAPYAARLDGPGVRDVLLSGVVISRDLEPGPYSIRVDVDGDSSGCSWALFVDSISDEDFEVGLGEQLHRDLLESEWRTTGIEPVKCSSSSGSLTFVESSDAQSLDHRWVCEPLETYAAESERLSAEEAAREAGKAASEAKREAEQAAREAEEAARDETLGSMPPAPKGKYNCASLEGETLALGGDELDVLDPKLWACDGIEIGEDAECRTATGAARVVTPAQARALQDKFPSEWDCHFPAGGGD